MEEKPPAVKDQSTAQARQGQIVKAARQVIGEKGFHPATVREIGAAAGLTQGTLYAYARSKDEILFLVLDELVRADQEAVKSGIARERDPRQRVRAVIRAFTEVVLQRQDDILLLYQEVHALEPGLRRRLLARTHEIFDDVTAVVEEASRQGIINTPSPYFASHVITFLPVMIALRRWDMRGRVAPEDVAEWVVDFIMRGLEHEPERPGGRTPAPRRRPRTPKRRKA